MTPYSNHYLYPFVSGQITNTPGEMASDIEYLYMIEFSLLVTTEISFLVGLMTHLFIITVTVLDWRKRGTVSTSDQVILSIMVSRMFLQIVIQLNLFWKFYCAMCSHIYYLVIRSIYFSIMYSSIWLSTLLCVVFYLKIYNFHGDFFLWLRRIFSKRILHFIIASLLISISQTSVINLLLFTTNIHFAFLNSTQTRKPIHVLFAVSFANMFGPLLIFLLSSLLLISSLYHHIKLMRCNREMTSSLDAYYRIIKYTSGSLVTSVLSVLISALADRYYYVFGFVLFSFPWTTFETLHSILVIYLTPKLRNSIFGILKYLRNYLIKREEPRDSLMTITT